MKNTIDQHFYAITFLTAVSAIAFVLTLAMILMSCDFSPEGVFGRPKSNYPEVSTISSGCTSVVEAMAEAPASATSGTDSVNPIPSSLPSPDPVCPSPSRAIASVTAMPNGIIDLWVSALSDGQNPVVEELTYAQVGDSKPRLTYKCGLASVSSPDGQYKKIECTPNSESQIVPVQPATYPPNDLLLYSITLVNPSCQRVIGFQRVERSVDCYSEQDSSNHGMILNGVEFPNLLMTE